MQPKLKSGSFFNVFGSFFLRTKKFLVYSLEVSWSGVRSYDKNDGNAILRAARKMF